LQSSYRGPVSCVLDTNIVIDFLRGRAYAHDLLAAWAEKGALAISTLTHVELYHGLKSGEQEVTDVFLDGLLTVPVDVAIARRAGKMLRDLRSRGVTFGIADAVIAATALQTSAPLLTNNEEHYPFPALRVVPGIERQKG